MVTDNNKKLFIKNMVCPRCVMVVRDTLEALGLEVEAVELGKAVVSSDKAISTHKIEKNLKEYGFELIYDQNYQLVEQIKTMLIQYIQDLETTDGETSKISAFLADKLHQNYSSLSSAFSNSEDTTIEKYLIHLKIERVKELLSYGDLTLSEIAFKLKYSSVAYLSNQFKKITGMSVTDYKKARDSFRKPLDAIE